MDTTTALFFVFPAVLLFAAFAVITARDATPVERLIFALNCAFSITLPATIHMKRSLISLRSKTFSIWLPVCLMLGLSDLGHAQSQVVSGQIVSYHLNGNFPDRGVCVATAPALPGSPNACLYKTNALYKEITAMLLLAYSSGKTCQLWLDQKDASGYWLLSIAQCSE